MKRSLSTPDPARAVRWIRRHCPIQPRLGIVLGSGFGPVADALPNPIELPYSDIPGFAVGSVIGHAGRLLLADWHGIPIAVLAGRAHYYEGFDWPQVLFPVRVLAALGIRELLLTNAAGGIRRGFRPGDFMILTDHLNFMGANPLRGPAPPGCPRFIDLSSTYDSGLQKRLATAARTAGIKPRKGVYVAVSGPSFETPAEIRAYRTLGADAVGMSTVPEALAARECGVLVAGLSCITNVAAGLPGGTSEVSHQEVLDTAREVAPRATRLVSEFVSITAHSPIPSTSP